MKNGGVKRIFFAAVTILVLLGLGVYYYLSSGKGYRNLQTSPKAQSVEELRYLIPPVNSKESLYTDLSVPETSKWYLANLSSTEYTLDIEPENKEDEQVQMIQLKKGVEILSISLVSDPVGGTNVTFEKFGDPNAGGEGKDPE